MDNQLKPIPQPTDVDMILQAMERLLSPERIGSIERFIVGQSLRGFTYHEMANMSNYTSIYFAPRTLVTFSHEMKGASL